MEIFPIKFSRVCGLEANGRILNYDQNGRSFRLLAFKRPLGARRVSVLSELKVGESGVLVSLELPESVQNHLMHMGFVPGALVVALRKAPAGEPTVYGVDGMEIALRHETAEAIRVKPPVVEEDEENSDADETSRAQLESELAEAAR